MSEKKAVSVDWKKWNRLRMAEKIKCFFGFHEWKVFMSHDVGGVVSMVIQCEVCQNKKIENVGEFL